VKGWDSRSSGSRHVHSHKAARVRWMPSVRHVRAAVVLVAGLALSAVGFFALGPSLGAFTATVSGASVQSQAGTLGLAVAAPNGQPECTATVGVFSATCSGADVSVAAAPSQLEGADWLVQSSGTITPGNDPGFALSLGASGCTSSSSTTSNCSDTDVAVQESSAALDSVTALPEQTLGDPADPSYYLEEADCPSATLCLAVGTSSAGEGVVVVSDDGGPPGRHRRS